MAWKARVGEHVKAGQLLGEIVPIDHHSSDTPETLAPRVPVLSRTDGIVYGVRTHKLAIPGEIMIKVAGAQPLDWRTGNLLTSR